MEIFVLKLFFTLFIVAIAILPAFTIKYLMENGDKVNNFLFKHLFSVNFFFLQFFGVRLAKVINGNNQFLRFKIIKAFPFTKWYYKEIFKEMFGY